MYVYICTCTCYVHAHVCVSMDVSVCLYAHDVCMCCVGACMHFCKVRVCVCSTVYASMHHACGVCSIYEFVCMFVRRVFQCMHACMHSFIY
jgi:hypothetical protein